MDSSTENIADQYVEEATQEEQEKRSSEGVVPEILFMEKEVVSIWQRNLTGKEILGMLVLVVLLIGLFIEMSTSSLWLSDIEAKESTTLPLDQNGVVSLDAVSTAEGTMGMNAQPTEEGRVQNQAVEPEVAEPMDTGFADEEELEEMNQKSQHLMELEKALQGEWVLMDSYFWDKGRYNVLPEQKGIREREYLSFTEQQYSRVLDQGLYFSGTFAAEDPIELPYPIEMIEGSTVFLLHSMNVSSSISGFTKNHEFYYAELKEDSLLLFQLGTRLSSIDRPIRGHRYKRKGYVYRRR